MTEPTPDANSGEPDRTEVDSNHEHPQGESTTAPDDRRRLDHRPARHSDVSGHAGRDTADRLPATVDASQPAEGGESLPRDLQQVVSLVLAQIESHAHLHFPVQLPDTGALDIMKRDHPTLYREYIRQFRAESDQQRWMERAPIEQPAKIATRGQRYALIVVFLVLVLAGYAAYKDQPWLAGFLGAIDIIGLAAIFNNGPGSAQGEHRKRKPDEAESS